MYIDAARYSEITGRDLSEVSDEVLEAASRLLDARIGPRRHAGDYKLDVEALPEAQRRAVEEWTARAAQMIVARGSVQDTGDAIRLGRFSVTPQSGSDSKRLPDSMVWADQMLSAAGLVRRKLRFRSTREALNAKIGL